MTPDSGETADENEVLDAPADSEEAVLSDAVDDDAGDYDDEIDVVVEKASSLDDTARKRDVKRRLEEIAEQRLAMRNLDSTYNFNLDDY